MSLGSRGQSETIRTERPPLFKIPSARRSAPGPHGWPHGALKGPHVFPFPRREGRLGAGTEREGFRDLGSLRNLQHSFVPLENSTLQSPSPSFRRIANDIFVGWRRWGGGVDHVFRLNILPLVFPTSLASQPINNLIKKDF